MSKSGEFYSFGEVLKRLNLDETRLKRLVADGDIRAFREGDQMKFRKCDVEDLDLTGARQQESGTGPSAVSEELFADDSFTPGDDSGFLDDIKPEDLGPGLKTTVTDALQTCVAVLTDPERSASQIAEAVVKAQQALMELGQHERSEEPVPAAVLEGDEEGEPVFVPPADPDDDDDQGDLDQRYGKPK